MNNNRPKLSLEIAREIRRRLEGGESANSIAHEYGVAEYSIRRIRRGESYREAGSKAIAPYRSASKLNKQKAEMIRKAIRQGESLTGLARRYGVSKQTIVLIRDGMLYRA